MVKMFFEQGKARCGKCHRMLFKFSPKSRIFGIEIKCHSCKEINASEFRSCESCKWFKAGVCMSEKSRFLMQEKEKKAFCDDWEQKD